MELSPKQITIAVTVYSRRQYVLQAIDSALNQTVPVKVMVVEDCGPDESLRDFIVTHFKDRIVYMRNSKNRGLFDNWNACLEYCSTPWLSILHDDDFLRPNFVETMFKLATVAPGRGLYFGRAAKVSEDDRIEPPDTVNWESNWQDLDLKRLADECFLFFPGQVFCVRHAQSLGGFRRASFLTGDWDMWFRLALHFGGAQSASEVAASRTHYGSDRGSTRVERKGWKWALENVQRKRNLAVLLHERRIAIPFERTKLLKTSPIPSRLLLRDSREFNRRMLKYNAWLFTHSTAPNARYAALQWITRIGGPNTLRIGSILWNRIRQLVSRARLAQRQKSQVRVDRKIATN